MGNFVTEVVRREKEGYVNYSYVHAKKDTRFLWKTLEQLNVHNSTGNQLPQHLKDVNNINSHFINSIDQMFCKISPETEEFYLTHRLPGNPNSFNFDLVSEHMDHLTYMPTLPEVTKSEENIFNIALTSQEVRDAVTSMTAEARSGSDDIPNSQQQFFKGDLVKCLFIIQIYDIHCLPRSWSLVQLSKRFMAYVNTYGTRIMEVKCSKCSISCAPDSKGIFKCDICKKSICKRCSGLCPTEIRVMELTGQRKLIYACTECESKADKDNLPRRK
nr:unnamed protein product [Callosobruchus analis]